MKKLFARWRTVKDEDKTNVTAWDKILVVWYPRHLHFTGKEWPGESDTSYWSSWM